MTDLNVWSIEQRKVSDLIPHERNPRKISPEKLSKLKDRITSQGFRTPPCVDNDGILLAGHQRCKTLIDMGLGDMEIPVSVPPYKLTEKQRQEILASDNISFGEFDWDILNEDFDAADLFELGFDIELPEVEVIPQADEDEVIEPPKEPKTVLGDVYEIGNHRLVCGDSTCIDTVDKLMDGNKADMVFTDPPYGVSYSNNMNDNFDEIKNDDVFLDILPCLLHASKENIHWYIWTSQQVYPTLRDMFQEYYKNTIIWSKGGGGLGDLEGNYSLNYEMCLFCHYGRKELYGSRDGAVWEIKKDAGSTYVHPTQKPVELSEYALSKSSKSGDNILDLFGGSGSTMVASHKTNRTCYMMELDPKYCDVIVNRMNKLYPDLEIKLNGEPIEWDSTEKAPM